VKFAKPPKTFDEQVHLLISRGMVVDNLERALRYLSHLNYYRLAAYWLPYEQDHSTHRFKTGTRFETILEHYVFDRELRLLVMDAIERIEISLRTRWAYHLAHTYGPHAHLNPNIHKKDHRYQENIALLMDCINPHSQWKRRLDTLFVKHSNVSAQDMGFPFDWRDRPIWHRPV
jgi:abortive infection bacteriophage resistance protein